jgi:hypothetical protein
MSTKNEIFWNKKNRRHNNDIISILSKELDGYIFISMSSWSDKKIAEKAKETTEVHNKIMTFRKGDITSLGI